MHGNGIDEGIYCSCQPMHRIPFFSFAADAYSVHCKQHCMILYLTHGSYGIVSGLLLITVSSQYFIIIQFYINILGGKQHERSNKN